MEILDEHQIEALGMGMLMGVARGSSEPPRLMVFRHNPPGVSPSSPVLGLVGKGITFDTGGISIKPAEGMERKDLRMGLGPGWHGCRLAAALAGEGVFRTVRAVHGPVPGARLV